MSSAPPPQDQDTRPPPSVDPLFDPLAELLVASADGDQGAFAALYDAVAPRVFGLVLGVVRDRRQSEEVTQEVMLQVWQTGSRFDASRGSGLGWVLTIAHRRAVDRVRSSDASRRRDSVHAWRPVEVPFDSTEATALGVSDAARVRSAVEQLTPLQSEAVRLAYFGGHTHTEVARLLGIPQGTARTRIRDGLIRLRDGLGVSTV